MTVAASLRVALPGVIAALAVSSSVGCQPVARPTPSVQSRSTGSAVREQPSESQRSSKRSERAGGGGTSLAVDATERNTSSAPSERPYPHRGFPMQLLRGPPGRFVPLAGQCIRVRYLPSSDARARQDLPFWLRMDGALYWSLPDDSADTGHTVDALGPNELRLAMWARHETVNRRSRGTVTDNCMSRLAMSLEADGVHLGGAPTFGTYQDCEAALAAGAPSLGDCVIDGEKHPLRTTCLDRVAAFLRQASEEQGKSSPANQASAEAGSSGGEPARRGLSSGTARDKASRAPCEPATERDQGFPIGVFTGQPWYVAVTRGDERAWLELQLHVDGHEALAGRPYPWRKGMTGDIRLGAVGASSVTHLRIAADGYGFFAVTEASSWGPRGRSRRGSRTGAGCQDRIQFELAGQMHRSFQGVPLFDSPAGCSLDDRHALPRRQYLDVDTAGACFAQVIVRLLEGEVWGEGTQPATSRARRRPSKAEPEPSYSRDAFPLSLLSSPEGRFTVLKHRQKQCVRVRFQPGESRPEPLPFWLAMRGTLSWSLPDGSAEVEQDVDSLGPSELRLITRGLRARSWENGKWESNCCPRPYACMSGLALGLGPDGSVTLARARTFETLEECEAALSSGAGPPRDVVLEGTAQAGRESCLDIVAAFLQRPKPSVAPLPSAP